MSELMTKLRQPSTLMALGLLLGAVVYAFTKSASLALAAASIIPGALNDHTVDLLSKIEALENAANVTSSKLMAMHRDIVSPKPDIFPPGSK